MEQKTVFPAYYDPSRAGERFDVDYDRVFEAALAAVTENGIRPSIEDRIKVLLMPIDMQICFVDPRARQLPVRGGVGDCRRTAEFIYREVCRITKIAPTLDSHHFIQIFHRTFLVDKRGNPPPANTLITAVDVANGVWRVRPEAADAYIPGEHGWVQRYLEYYTTMLGQTGNGVPLITWPFHGLPGSQAHALMPILEEACRFHETARMSPLRLVTKGDDVIRENYSVFGPKVTTTHDGWNEWSGGFDFKFEARRYDMVIVPGEAGSHCLLDSVEDLVDGEDGNTDPIARKTYVLTDCTSPVVIVPGDPNLDFTPVQEAGFKRLAARGVHFVKSTDPIEEWPESPFRK